MSVTHETISQVETPFLQEYQWARLELLQEYNLKVDKKERTSLDGDPRSTDWFIGEDKWDYTEDSYPVKVTFKCGLGQRDELCVRKSFAELNREQQALALIYACRVAYRRTNDSPQIYMERGLDGHEVLDLLNEITRTEPSLTRTLQAIYRKHVNSDFGPGETREFTP